MTSIGFWIRHCINKYALSCFTETKELKEMQISHCGLPKAILATFCCGGNKTSMGDAVGKDSFQIQAGGMEPQPAALRSELGDLQYGGAGFVPPSPWLSVRELEQCGLVSSCVTLWWVVLPLGGSHQKLGCSLLTVERCSLCSYSQSCQVASQRRQSYSFLI